MEGSEAQSFRRLALARLRGIGGGGAIRILDPAHTAAGLSIGEALAVRGDFSCGPGSSFTRPVYVRGHCEIGKGSRLEAIAAEGDMILQPAVRVRNWIDSGGRMELRAGCRIGGLASSRTAIRVGLGAMAGSLFAPEIATQDWREESVEGEATYRRGAIEIPPPEAEGAAPPPRIPGIDRGRLHAAGPETWIYEGDWEAGGTILLRAKLITAGSFACAAGSLLENDVEAGGALLVGEHCLARGNLAARGDLVVGPGSVFQATVRSRGSLRLREGSRGLREGGPAEAHAAGELLVESNVVVRGRLSSGCRVVAVRVEPRTPLERFVAGLGA